MSSLAEVASLRAPGVVTALGPDAEALLAALVARARQERPEVVVADADLVAHAVASVAAAEDIPAAFASLHAGDLALACACVAGDPSALRLFDERFLRQIPQFVASATRGHEVGDDVTQLVREKLLVGPDGGPGKLVEYRGSGPLGGWLRVVAVRTARNFIRDGKDAERLGTVEERALKAPDPDPELEYLKSRYARELSEAFTSTLESLSTDDRGVLSMYYVDGLASEAIGKVYGVHGATIRRRIEKLRERLLERTRALLADRVGGRPEELSSLIALVQSQVDLRLSQLLRRR